MDSLFVFSVIALCAAVSHGLSGTRWGRPIGGAILVILMAAVLANLGVIPAGSKSVPLYDQILGIGAPVSIFWLLLHVRLAALRQAGAAMLGLFALGAGATMAGVLLAGWLTGASDWLGDWYAPLTGMYTATYIGGGANFNALASHYHFFETGNLFAAATVVDHVVTVVWITALLVIPRLLRRVLPRLPPPAAGAKDSDGDRPAARTDEESIDLGSLAVLVVLGFGAHWSSVALSGVAERSFRVEIPSILILTTLALIAAQLPAVARLKGTHALGMYGAYLFLAVLGCYCEAAAMVELGGLGIRLFAFVALAVGVHGLVLFGGGLLLRQPPELVAVASTANIGGSTVVLPLVEALKCRDYLLPGILVGALGNALGTYLGFLVVRWVSA